MEAKKKHRRFISVLTTSCGASLDLDTNPSMNIADFNKISIFLDPGKRLLYEALTGLSFIPSASLIRECNNAKAAATSSRNSTTLIQVCLTDAKYHKSGSVLGIAEQVNRLYPFMHTLVLGASLKMQCSGSYSARTGLAYMSIL